MGGFVAFATVRVTAEIHDILTQFRLQISAELKRDISMGEIVRAAFQVAESHHPEFVEKLRAVE
jgi:hypothetical protein